MGWWHEELLREESSLTSLYLCMSTGGAIRRSGRKSMLSSRLVDHVLDKDVSTGRRFKYSWQKDTRGMSNEEKWEYIFSMPTDIEGQCDRWLEISAIQLSDQ